MYFEWFGQDLGLLWVITTSSGLRYQGLPEPWLMLNLSQYYCLI